MRIATLLLVLAGCRSADAPRGAPPPAAHADAAAAGAPAAALPALRPLDDAHASEFRRAFDEATDRPRYIVALSPT
jgi:hypothetical protein